MIDAASIEQLARELLEAERRSTPVVLLTDRYSDLSWDDARAIARATDGLRRAEGDRVIGYKLGWTSAAIREALGIGRPNWGTLWTSNVASGHLDITDLIHPKIEPELVYRVPLPIDASEGVGAGDIARLRGDWALGLEVVDPRYPDYGFRWLDNTADNSSAARIVVGPFVPLGDSWAPAEERVEFTDGRQSHSGVGANAMSDPCAAVAWLAESLHAEGSELAPGQLVFTGGLTSPFDVRAGATYTLSSPNLPTVNITAR